MEQKDLMMFAVLMLSLFLIAIVTGVTYIGMDQLKKTTCEQANDNFVWSAGECQTSSTNTTAQIVTAITKITKVETAIDVALGLLTLVVLMTVFKVVIKSAKSFGASGF